MGEYADRLVERQIAEHGRAIVRAKSADRHDVRRLVTLVMRAKFLRRRVERRMSEGADVEHDAQELGALRWALARFKNEDPASVSEAERRAEDLWAKRTATPGKGPRPPLISEVCRLLRCKPGEVVAKLEALLVRLGEEVARG